MDVLDIIINFINVTDSSNLINKNWIILSDKNEYQGERNKAFFSFLILIILYLFIITFIIYLIKYLFFK
ncbi:hypothetical protein GCM10022388_07290 [Flavobacterium chungnamense]|uniref:Uncharacterized protein n=1 Tax=Flavobacterium chungnamense TaxID=706182 RepID=A0ABP7UIU9_9FLAO